MDLALKHHKWVCYMDLSGIEDEFVAKRRNIPFGEIKSASTRALYQQIYADVQDQRIDSAGSRCLQMIYANIILTLIWESAIDLGDEVQKKKDFLMMQFDGLDEIRAEIFKLLVQHNFEDTDTIDKLQAELKTKQVQLFIAHDECGELVRGAGIFQQVFPRSPTERNQSRSLFHPYSSAIKFKISNVKHGEFSL